MRDFAERLISHETKGNKPFEVKLPAAFLVVDKLRPHLSNLMGSSGFRALLSRSLALASAEVPWLRALHVKPDGSLEGLEKFETQIDPDKFLEGRVVLLAALLGLLVAFIGEKLTVQLVRGVWPKLSLNDLDFSKGAKSEKAK